MQQNQNRLQDDVTWAKLYANYERTVLLLAGGQHLPFTALTDEDLPVFFKDFQPFRNKTSSARLFAERYLTEMWPNDRPQSPFLFTTEMLKTFKELGFCGSDPRITYALRERGISLFSVLPQLHDRTSDALRNQMVQYESTHDQHTPQDRAALDALSVASGASIGATGVPSTRLDVRDRLDFFATWLRIFFGGDMPLLAGLNLIIMALNRDTHTSNWTPSTWHAFFWNLHRGIRFFFQDGHPDWFNRQVTKFTDGDGPDRSNVPLEVFRTPPARVTPPGSVGSDDMSALTDPSSGSTTSKKRKAAERAPATPPPPGRGALTFPLQFKQDIDRASVAQKASITANMLADTPAKRSALLGPDFMCLANGNCHGIHAHIDSTHLGPHYEHWHCHPSSP